MENGSKTASKTDLRAVIFGQKGRHKARCTERRLRPGGDLGATWRRKRPKMIQESFFDGVILAHCNESEWNRFKSEHTNEAILDRVVKISVPYVLELDQEQKI